MSVILESERSTVKARAFVALLYAILALGAATMVYPFAVSTREVIPESERRKDFRSTKGLSERSLIPMSRLRRTGFTIWWTW